MCETCGKHAAPVGEKQRDILFEEAVCSPEFAEGCKEPQGD